MISGMARPPPNEITLSHRGRERNTSSQQLNSLGTWAKPLHPQPLNNSTLLSAFRCFSFPLSTFHVSQVVRPPAGGQSASPYRVSASRVSRSAFRNSHFCYGIDLTPFFDPLRRLLARDSTLRGSENVRTAPPPRLLVAEIHPLWSSTIRLQIESPSPVP